MKKGSILRKNVSESQTKPHPSPKRRAAAFLLLIVALCLSATLLASCNKTTAGISYVSVRTYHVSGVEYERYTYSFPYTESMVANYYEIKVEQSNTTSYIPQGQFYFVQAENAGGTKMRVPDSPAYFSVNLTADVGLLTLSLVRCNKPSSQAGFEILETVYSATFNV